MIISTSIELRELTGSFYANNDFTKVKTDVELETEDIVRLIGKPVYDRASAAYEPSNDPEEPGKPKPDATDTDKELLQRVQLAVAMRAAYRYFQSNIVSHDDTGRKVKVDKNNETMAWEWMLDRDDAAHLRKSQRATDRLIDWLDASEINEWKDSDQKKIARKLFVPNTATFQLSYPIDNSGTFYYTVAPFMANIQRTTIRKALGDDYHSLLQAFVDDNVSEEQEELLLLTQQALSMLTMATALKRLSIQVLPEGVIQQYRGERSNGNASAIPTTEDLRKYALFLERDAESDLDEIRKYRYRHSPEDNPIVLIPENNPCRKFART